MPDSDDSRAPQMRWQFIDSSNDSRRNLTQVKRHVMHEYMRQKRQGDSQRHSDDERPAGESSQPNRRQPRKTRASRKTTGRGRKGKDNKQKRMDAGNTTQDAPGDVEEVERQPTTGYTGSVPALCLPHRTSPKPARFLRSHNVPDLTEQSGSSDFGALTPSRSSRPASPLEVPLSPRSILSAARTDPFNSLPMELDMEGQKLFDFYVKEMPACSYGTHFRTSKAHNWYTAVFVPEGMKGAVTFQNTVLVHAANTWAWVRNETETEYTLAYRDRAISMLRDHMVNNPQDISDVAIIACISAAGLEDFDPRPGRKHISWLHMRAAREMIRARGGPAAFENTRLGMLINWQDYILSGYETNGPSFFFERDPLISLPLTEQGPSPADLSPQFLSMPSPPDSISSSLFDNSTCSPTELVMTTARHHLSPREELLHQCGEFIDFLKRCEQLALYQKRNPDATGPTRLAAFQNTALLRQILAAPPGVRFTASGDRKQFVARLVSLMMLNAGLWDYRHAVPRSEAFLAALEQDIIGSEVNTSGSIEALLQIMLACKDGSFESIPGSDLNIPLDLDVTLNADADFPDFSQYAPTARTPYARPWFIGRMLKVAKRLSLDSWLRVNEILFSCLTMQVEEGVEGVWEEELRGEVMGAPGTCYVMPSLGGWAA